MGAVSRERLQVRLSTAWLACSWRIRACQTFVARTQPTKRATSAFATFQRVTYYLLAFQRDEGSRVLESRARQKIEVGGDNLDGITISLEGGITIPGRIKIDGSSSVTFDRLHLQLMPLDEDGQLGGHSEVKKDGSLNLSQSTTAVTY